MSTYVQTVEASMSPSPSTAGSAAKEESSTNVGIIVGAVAGGLLGLVLLGAVVSFILVCHMSHSISDSLLIFHLASFQPQKD